MDYPARYKWKKRIGKTGKTLIVALIILIVVSVLCVIPYLINYAYVLGVLDKEVNTAFSASDMILFYGSILTFLGTITLGIVTVKINMQANKTNRIILENQLKTTQATIIRGFDKITMMRYIDKPVNTREFIEIEDTFALFSITTATSYKNRLTFSLIVDNDNIYGQAPISCKITLNDINPGDNDTAMDQCIILIPLRVCYDPNLLTGNKSQIEFTILYNESDDIIEKFLKCTSPSFWFTIEYINPYGVITSHEIWLNTKKEPDGHYTVTETSIGYTKFSVAKNIDDYLI